MLATLALLVAADEEVKRSFPDGTLWAEVGQQPDVLELLQVWLGALFDPASSSSLAHWS